MDLYAYVEEIHQDTSITAETDSVAKNCNFNKQQTSQHDTLDSLRLALCNYELPKYNP